MDTIEQASDEYELADEFEARARLCDRRGDRRRARRFRRVRDRHLATAVALDRRRRLLAS